MLAVQDRKILKIVKVNAQLKLNRVVRSEINGISDGFAERKYRSCNGMVECK